MLEKPEGEIQKLATLGTKDTGLRQTKQKQHNTNPSEHRGVTQVLAPGKHFLCLINYKYTRRFTHFYS